MTKRLHQAALAAATAYTAYTLYLIARMFWFLWYTMTSAIRVDELIMMEEIRLFREGKYSIGYLWAPYWGHRILIQRLFMIADEKFFHLSNTPLVVAAMTAQVGTAVVLALMEWRLLRHAPRWLTILVITATVHLSLSSLQLENFAYGAGLMYATGWLGAFGSITLFALNLSDGAISRGHAAACLVCAMVCGLSIGSGVFIGPVIVLVAFGLRAKPRVLAALALISALFGWAYSAGYSNPGVGIGLGGAILHPLGTIRATALVLGGPITNQSLAWGTVCGVTGMLVLGVVAVRLLRGRASRKEAALTGICLFLLLNALSIALARFTLAGIAALGTHTLLPSRYLTVPLLFWGTLLAVVVANRGRTVFTALSAIAGAVVGYLTLNTVPSQLAVSMAWLEFHRTLDVAGAGMILDARDPKFLFELIPDQRILDYYRPYMQKNRISFFADKRASWIGRDLSQVFGNPINGCGGGIDARIPAGPSTVRIEGYVTGTGAKFPMERQIVITDSTGRIDGLGNTLVISEPRGGQDFVAYADRAAVATYMITPGRKACRFPG